MTVSRNADVGAGTSIGNSGKVYDPRLKDSRYRNKATEKISKKPQLKGRSQERSLMSGDINEKCPDYLSLKRKCNGRCSRLMLAVVGKDLAQDTALMSIIMFSFQEDPAGGFSYGTVYGRGTGARISGYVTLAGNLTFTAG